MPVNVADRDVSGVTVTLHAGARVTGRLEFDGAAQKPTADQLRIATVTVDPADGRSGSFNQFTMSRGVVDQSGQFKTYQLPAGRYVIRASAQVPGWSFKGASLGGRDVSDAAFEIGSEDVSNIVVTFTDRPSELTGTVSNGKGPDATATALPASITASATDLRGGRQDIAMRELKSGDLVDYIGTVSATLPDTLRFDITVVRAGGATSTMQLQREFYPQ